MIRYKRFLPYLFSIAAVIAFVSFKFLPFYSLRLKLIDGSQPALKIVAFPITEVKKILTYHSTYNRYISLNKEVSALKSRLIKMEELEAENARLGRLLVFKKNSQYSLLAAKVTSRDPANWSSSIIIDKGKNDGVLVNQCVLTEAGLAGKVVEAGNSSAKVMLINDPNSSVASLVERSREQGVTSGTITGNCILHFLPAKSDVQAGDMIITSGLGGVYPKGFVIGQVAAVGEDSSGLYKNCSIRPQSKLSSLEEVLVLLQ